MSTNDVFSLAPRDRAIRCLQLAAEAEAAAKIFFDQQVRDSYRRIAERWRLLAAEAEVEARTQEEPPLPA